MCNSPSVTATTVTAETPAASDVILASAVGNGKASVASGGGSSCLVGGIAACAKLNGSGRSTVRLDCCARAALPNRKKLSKGVTVKMAAAGVEAEVGAEALAGAISEDTRDCGAVGTKKRPRETVTEKLIPDGSASPITSGSLRLQFATDLSPPSSFLVCKRHAVGATGKGNMPSLVVGDADDESDAAVAARDAGGGERRCPGSLEDTVSDESGDGPGSGERSRCTSLGKGESSEERSARKQRSEGLVFPFNPYCVAGTPSCVAPELAQAWREKTVLDFRRSDVRVKIYTYIYRYEPCLALYNCSNVSSASKYIFQLEGRLKGALVEETNVCSFIESIGKMHLGAALRPLSSGLKWIIGFSRNTCLILLWLQHPFNTIKILLRSGGKRRGGKVILFLLS